MRMELIQPFVSAADSVLGQLLEGPTVVGSPSMEEDAYRRKGVAALIGFQGDIEGRIIFDLEPPTACTIAGHLSGSEPPATADDSLVAETLCELANMIIGNAVTLLNDHGFHFRVQPPEVHTDPEGLKSSYDTEAVVMSFDTPAGCVYLNIAMRYNRRRKAERAPALSA
ncbi:MAG TPA: chemotaxis protein CheX [Candidatus Acidoferrales bacterium]|nr:chemotaxis protein CheX [Candidatus Acidoferrales bacterium]